MRRRTALIFPGDLGTPTGGYVYDRRAFAALQDRGWRVNRRSLSGGFPFPDDHALAAADATLAITLAPSLDQQRLRSPTWAPMSKQNEPGRMKRA